VKYCISILAAAAIVALGASAAFGAGSNLPWEPSSGATQTGKTQTLGASKAAPSSQVTILLNKVKALTAKNKALAAKNRALAAEAKFQADRNVMLSNWIGELNKRIAGSTPAVTFAVDPDQECRDYLVCTPEQDCRLWGNNCPVVQPEPQPVDAMPANTEG
jgi:hypothetical protein